MALDLLNGHMGIMGECCPRSSKTMVCKEVGVQAQGYIYEFEHFSDPCVSKGLPTTRHLDLENRLTVSHWV